MGKTLNFHVRKNGEVTVTEEAARDWLEWLGQQDAETINVSVSGKVTVIDDPT